MERSLFGENTTGLLKEITVQGKKDWAFVPFSLPNEWNIPGDLWPLLAEAREELARLDGVGRHMTNYELLLQPLQKREAIKSSSLEGTYATPMELLLYEINPRKPKSAGDPANAWREVFNYGSSLQLGQSLMSELPFSLRFIRELHKELLKNVRGFNKNPGYFRNAQVHIGSDRRFIPPPPKDMLACLNEFEVHLHQHKKIDPLLYCFMAHYQFEAIHPFLDGNGRVGRLLLSLMIYQLCNLTNPWLYLSAYFDKHKDEYIDSLFKVSSEGDWYRWAAFCLRGTIQESKNAIQRIDNLLQLRDEYQNKMLEVGGNIRLSRIIEKLFEFPATSVPQIIKLNSISFPTAKSDIEKLMNIGVLHKSTIATRPQVYFALGIMDAAYSDLT